MSNSTKKIIDITISKPPKGAWFRQEADVLVLGARVRNIWGFAVLFYAMVLILFTGITILKAAKYGITHFNNFLPVLVIMFVGLVFFAVASTKTWSMVEIRIDETNCEIFRGVWIWEETKIYALNQIKIVQTGVYWDGKEVEILECNSQRIFPNSWVKLKAVHYNYLVESMCKVLSDKFQDEKFLNKEFYDDISEHLLEP